MTTRGQTAVVSIIGWGVAIALAAFTSYSASSARTDTQVNDLRERTASVEANITNLKTDVTEIKSDVKSILRAVK